MPDFQGGQDAHPTITLNSCGTGILPVANSQLLISYKPLQS